MYSEHHHADKLALEMEEKQEEKSIKVVVNANGEEKVPDIKITNVSSSVRIIKVLYKLLGE